MSCNAQATIEAAIMIPIIFLLLLLLIQPSIILYDLIIMKSAASDCCRILSTCSSAEKNQICDAYTRRRLSAIPQQDLFHVHSNQCSYELTFDGDQSSNSYTVEIKNQLKPIPFIGFFSDIFGILNDDKCFEITSSSTYSLKPKWAMSSPQGNNPESWAGSWLPK